MVLSSLHPSNQVLETRCSSRHLLDNGSPLEADALVVMVDGTIPRFLLLCFLCRGGGLINTTGIISTPEGDDLLQLPLKADGLLRRG